MIYIIYRIYIIRDRVDKVYVYYVQGGFYRSTVVYLRTLNPYLDSSFLIVILRIQLELIYWATTPPVIITLLTFILTFSIYLA